MKQRFTRLVYLGCLLVMVVSIAAAQQNGSSSDNEQNRLATGNQNATAAGQNAQQPAPQQVKPAPASPQKQDAKSQDTSIGEDPSTGQQYTSPTVVMLPSSGSNGDESPIMPTPEMPDGRVSLIGGTVDRVDQIRNRMKVHIFGGSSMKVFFDERSHIYRDGVETTQLALKPGERVYLDTQLEKDKIFARNIQIKTRFQPADASGQIVNYDPQRGEFTLMDKLSGRPVHFRTTSDTIITAKERNAKPVLTTGALVNVKFAPGPKRDSIAREVELLIAPGKVVNFFGTLTSLNLRTGLLGIRNKSDDQLYGVHFTPSTSGITADLQPGAEVVIESVFNGTGYDARSISVNRSASEVKDDQRDQLQDQNSENPKDQDNPR